MIYFRTRDYHSRLRFSELPDLDDPFGLFSDLHGGIHHIALYDQRNSSGACYLAAFCNKRIVMQRCSYDLAEHIERKESFFVYPEEAVVFGDEPYFAFLALP